MYDVHKTAVSAVLIAPINRGTFLLQIECAVKVTTTTTTTTTTCVLSILSLNFYYIQLDSPATMTVPCCTIGSIIGSPGQGTPPTSSLPLSGHDDFTFSRCRRNDSLCNGGIVEC